MSSTAMPMTVGAEEIEAALPMERAVDAVLRALREGLDPETDPARARVPVAHGELLLMPSQSARYAGVKLASVAPDNPARGLPRIQGGYLLLDAETLAPLALLDGVALTSVRTAAVSAAAAELLAPQEAAELVLFGTGPQAHSHLSALRAVRPLRRVTVVGRDQRRAREFAAARTGPGLTVSVAAPGAAADEAVAGADLVACCTSSAVPLFAGERVAGHATVLAVGSHSPEARETDDALVRRASVVVESRASALREAGDVLLPLAAGVLTEEELTGLAELARGEATLPATGPRFFKSTGMSWEDLALAAAAYEALPGRS
ncbi:ornithine cyclodeaminase family protein [Streptomyces sp. HNM0574]|uniref:ornithine cyclodeaminase family protein n=1 Tax=Streptomyces sp. HNM0574 TaxID=2714954 RepID=UPI001469C223|nr:ornithine cyclodeaminase family protein [Streptomyces sp. HNM0574]NLU65992.1 ornithine cyclodeaminase family protein [Streptomyces sp. HNM0574]